MKLVIPREKWLHGEGERDSYLLRPEDGKMCCVGIYLEALGISGEALRGVKSAEGEESIVLPDEAKWLAEPYDEDMQAPSALAYALYMANDSYLSCPYDADDEPYQWENWKPEFDSEEDQEKEITRLFAQQGVEVEFV